MKLEAEIYSLKKALPSSQATRVRIVDNAARHEGRPEQYLPTGSQIAFMVDDAAQPDDPQKNGRWISVKIVDSPHGRALELHAEWDGLVLYPSMSNVAFAAMAKRR